MAGPVFGSHPNRRPRYTKDEIKGLFVRRFKKDIADEVGEYFRDRETRLLHARATDEEETVFQRLKGLKFHTLNRKSRAGGKDILFKTTLLKAFLSSPFACLETIDHRLANIAKELAEEPAHREDLEYDQQVLELLRTPVEQTTRGNFAKLPRAGSLLEANPLDGTRQGAPRHHLLRAKSEPWQAKELSHGAFSRRGTGHRRVSRQSVRHGADGDCR